MAVRWPLAASTYRGLVDTVRQGRPLARALAVADSRALVRSMWLASAVPAGLLAYLREAHTAAEIAQQMGSRRPERLQAWLGVGVDLGELRLSGHRYQVKGSRARAVAGGDELLVAHYRSMLEYQVAPYAELERLLQDGPGQGRRDLDRYSDDIARVSLAAAPFVNAMIRQAVADLEPRRVLDVGCGTGVYTRVVLESGPQVEVDGVDLAEGVIVQARQRLAEAGFGARARLHVGDVREWLRQQDSRFDLVLLLNNIYYFDREQRVGLYRELGHALADGGQLLVVTMTTPGSVAAAHLHFMLVCQDGTASLPGRDDLVADLVAAGYEPFEERRLVPTEPFLGVRARRAV